MNNELKEMGKQLKEILDKYPHRQKEILFYIFGEDTIREIIGKPTYEELQQKVSKLEEENKQLLERLGKEVKRNIEVSNMSRAELIKMINQLETNRDEAITIGNKQLLSNSNHTKYTDEMCLIEVVGILERGKE